MIELLDYIKNLRLSPTNERLTATHKLALICLILDGGDTGEIEFNPDIVGEYCFISNRKSVFRLLTELERFSLLKVIPRRDAKGHPIPSLVYPLPLIERKPGNIHVTRDTQNQKPGNIYEPGNIQVPPVTSMQPGLNDSKQNGLDESAHGTKLALIPPSPTSYKKEGGETPPGNIQATGDLVQNPAVALWLSETGANEITEKAARMITGRVRNVEVWRQTLEGWLANPGWSKFNVDGQISRYEKKISKGEYYTNLENVDIKPPSPEEETKQRETEEKRRLIYNDNE